jgi:hypothetical protein
VTGPQKSGMRMHSGSGSSDMSWYSLSCGTGPLGAHASRLCSLGFGVSETVRSREDERESSAAHFKAPSWWDNIRVCFGRSGFALVGLRRGALLGICKAVSGVLHMILKV